MKPLFSLLAFVFLIGCNTTKISTIDDNLAHIQFKSKLAKDGSFFKKLEGENMHLFHNDEYALGFMPKYYLSTSDESKKIISLGFLINTSEWRFWDRAADTTHGIKFDFLEVSRETHSGAFVCWEQFVLTMSTDDAIKVANSYPDGNHGPWWITIAGQRWSETKVGINVNYLKAFLIKLGLYEKGNSSAGVMVEQDDGSSYWSF
ncbi:hypothetical protein OAV01_01810 [Opitutales bacterium]|nr:hypothetical protein [Opitutales bacterium]